MGLYIRLGFEFVFLILDTARRYCCASRCIIELCIQKEQYIIKSSQKFLFLLSRNMIFNFSDFRASQSGWKYLCILEKKTGITESQHLSRLYTEHILYFTTVEDSECSALILSASEEALININFGLACLIDFSKEGFIFLNQCFRPLGQAISMV
jgi:hypothetical protein